MIDYEILVFYKIKFFGIIILKKYNFFLFFVFREMFKSLKIYIICKFLWGFMNNIKFFLWNLLGWW